MKRRDALLIFLTLLLAYCYVLPRWADWNQNSRLNLVRALVEQQTTRIDAYVANTGDYAEFGDHAYTDKPPGLSLAGVPFYAAVLPLIGQPAVAQRLERLAGGGAMATTLNPAGTGIRTDKVRHFVAQYLLTMVTVALPAAALGVLLYAVLGLFGFARSLALLVTLGYGLATPALAYAGNYYSHQFVAALVFGAFALLLPWGQQPQARVGSLDRVPLLRTLDAPVPAVRALLFGLLCGYALISEYPVAIMVAALGVYGLTRMSWKAIGFAILGGLLPIVLMGVYNLRSFDTIWPVGYAHSALWQNQHHTGFMSITYPRAEALWGLTFGSYRGLFFRAPWLLLAIPGFVLWWRSREWRGAWWVTLISTIGLNLFYGSSIMWWGGFGVGPRYTVPMLPFLALAAAYGIRPLWRSMFGRGVTVALLVASAGLTWAETLARQSFPLDTILQPWRDYTLPSWLSGDIARNLGMAAGLRGPLSLLPLAVALAILIGWLARNPANLPHVRQPIQPATDRARISDVVADP